MKTSTAAKIEPNDRLRIAIVGATGNVGSRLVNEALGRGHVVTAITRNPESLSKRTDLVFASGDAGSPESLSQILKEHDVVISSVGFRVSKADLLIDAVRRSGVKRYLVVGGAGSLEIAPGELLVNSPQFPAEYRDEALGGKAFLDTLRAAQDLDWTMLSPSALFVPGLRTGKFKLGQESLLTGVDGKSWITYEDFAVAMLDEIESPQHVRRRFTVGY